MDLGLRGRKALITGASRGIGRACAEVLAEEGCDVVLVSRTAADLEAARATIIAQHNVAVRCLSARPLGQQERRYPGGGMSGDRSPGQQRRCDPARHDRRNGRGALARRVGSEGVRLRQHDAALLRADGRAPKGVIINIIGAAGESVQSDYITGSSGNASLMAFTGRWAAPHRATGCASSASTPARSRPTA